MPAPLIAGAVGAAACALIGFVVVIGGSDATPTEPSFNVDALPVAAQNYAPYLIEAGDICPRDVNSALVAAQITVLNPAWSPNLVTTYTYGTKQHPIVVVYDGLLQQTPGWWTGYGLNATTDAPGGDPFNPQDAIESLAQEDCNLAAQMGVDALSAQSSLPIPELVAAAFFQGPTYVQDLAQQLHELPADPQLQEVIVELAAYSLDGSTLPAGPGGSVAPGPPVPPSSVGAAIVAAAETQLGVPYQWGGGNAYGPTGGGFDCSGLVLYSVYQATHGAILLPHLSEDQVLAGQQIIIGSGAQALRSGLLEPGDLIGFFNLDADDEWDHIGIYVGGGDMIDAPHTGADVEIDNLATSYWEGVQWDVRRIS